MTQYPKFPPEQAAKPSITERIILALIHSEKDSRARRILLDLAHEMRATGTPKELSNRERVLIEYANERCNGMAPRCGHWIVQYEMNGARPQYRLECAVCFHVYGIFDWDVNEEPPKVEADPDFEVKDADPKNIKYDPMKPFTMYDEEISRETHDAIHRERKPWSNCPLCLGNGGLINWGYAQVKDPGSVATPCVEWCECWRGGEAYAKQIERRRERDVAFDEPRTASLRQEDVDKIRSKADMAGYERGAAAAKIGVRVEIELRLNEVFRKERERTERWEGRHGLDRLARIESLVREALQG